MNVYTVVGPTNRKPRRVHRATAVANEIKEQLDDFVRDAPVTVMAIAYGIKREEEQWLGPDPLSIPGETTIH